MHNFEINLVDIINTPVPRIKKKKKEEYPREKKERDSILRRIIAAIECNNYPLRTFPRYLKYHDSLIIIIERIPVSSRNSLLIGFPTLAFA